MNTSSLCLNCVKQLTEYFSGDKWQPQLGEFAEYQTGKLVSMVEVIGIIGAVFTRLIVINALGVGHALRFVDSEPRGKHYSK